MGSFHYEVDELKTYVGRKTNDHWICVAVERETGRPVDVAVGKRTKKTLAKVLDTLKLSEAEKVYTDGLDIYRSLLPKETHKVRPYHINKVERMNLDLRNSLKRLTRKTICYSKSRAMLEASVRLCLWGGRV
jgi:IS1 family transposase